MCSLCALKVDFQCEIITHTEPEEEKKVKKTKDRLKIWLGDVFRMFYDLWGQSHGFLGIQLMVFDLLIKLL